MRRTSPQIVFGLDEGGIDTAAVVITLGWVTFTDIYVRLVSMGVITDLNTWN